MKKYITIITISVALFFTSGVIVYAGTTNFQQTIYEITECNDGIDNDTDGLVDFASDPECLGWDDDSESISGSSRTSSAETSTSSETSSITTSTASTSEASEQQDNIFVQITEEIDNIFNKPRESVVLNTFIWQPLGEILGLTEEIESLSDAEFTTINMSLFGLLLYPLAAMIVTLSVLINVSRKKK